MEVNEGSTLHGAIGWPWSLIAHKVLIDKMSVLHRTIDSHVSVCVCKRIFLFFQFALVHPVMKIQVDVSTGIRLQDLFVNAASGLSMPSQVSFCIIGISISLLMIPIIATYPFFPSNFSKEQQKVS